MRKRKLPDPAIVAEVRRLLIEAKITQYALRQAGLSSNTSQILLGDLGGIPSLPSCEVALSLLTPPRSLWHVVASRRPQ